MAIALAPFGFRPRAGKDTKIIDTPCASGQAIGVGDLIVRGSSGSTVYRTDSTAITGLLVGIAAEPVTSTSAGQHVQCWDPDTEFEAQFLQAGNTFTNEITNFSGQAYDVIANVSPSGGKSIAYLTSTGTGTSDLFVVDGLSAIPGNTLTAGSYPIVYGHFAGAAISRVGA